MEVARQKTRKTDNSTRAALVPVQKKGFAPDCKIYLIDFKIQETIADKTMFCQVLEQICYNFLPDESLLQTPDLLLDLRSFPSLKNFILEAKKSWLKKLGSERYLLLLHFARSVSRREFCKILLHLWKKNCVITVPSSLKNSANICIPTYEHLRRFANEYSAETQKNLASLLNYCTKVQNLQGLQTLNQTSLDEYLESNTLDEQFKQILEQILEPNEDIGCWIEKFDLQAEAEAEAKAEARAQAQAQMEAEDISLLNLQKKKKKQPNMQTNNLRLDLSPPPPPASKHKTFMSFQSKNMLFDKNSNNNPRIPLVKENNSQSSRRMEIEPEQSSHTLVAPVSFLTESEEGSKRKSLELRQRTESLFPQNWGEVMPLVESTRQYTKFFSEMINSFVDTVSEIEKARTFFDPNIFKTATTNDSLSMTKFFNHFDMNLKQKICKNNSETAATVSEFYDINQDPSEQPYIIANILGDMLLKLNWLYQKILTEEITFEVDAERLFPNIIEILCQTRGFFFSQRTNILNYPKAQIKATTAAAKANAKVKQHDITSSFQQQKTMTNNKLSNLKGPPDDKIKADEDADSLMRKKQSSRIQTKETSMEQEENETDLETILNKLLSGSGNKEGVKKEKEANMDEEIEKNNGNKQLQNQLRMKKRKQKNLQTSPSPKHINEKSMEKEKGKETVDGIVDQNNLLTFTPIEKINEKKENTPATIGSKAGDEKIKHAEGTKDDLPENHNQQQQDNNTEQVEKATPHIKEQLDSQQNKENLDAAVKEEKEKAEDIERKNNDLKTDQNPQQVKEEIEKGKGAHNKVQTNLKEKLPTVQHFKGENDEEKNNEVDPSDHQQLSSGDEPEQGDDDENNFVVVEPPKKKLTRGRKPRKQKTGQDKVDVKLHQQAVTSKQPVKRKQSRKKFLNLDLLTESRTRSGGNQRINYKQIASRYRIRTENDGSSDINQIGPKKCKLDL